MSKLITNMVDGTAVAYLLAYTCLMEKDKEVRIFYSDNVSTYIFPAIINAAFSCEVALKNLIKTHKNLYARGHNLKKLYMKLPQQLQEKYKNQTIAFYNEITLFGCGTLSENEFYTYLDQVKDTYERKRYLYEGQFGMDLDFLEALMFSLNDSKEEYLAFKQRMVR